MAKHKNEDAFYARMNELAQSKKPSVKESRTLGTLVDVKRTADGVAYGIVKEQHQYYIKKGGLKKDPNIADFAYIGGLSNITEHQYPTLAVADKNRNFLLATINESLSTKVSKTGSKKAMLTEDKAAKEIASAETKLGDAEAATDVAAAEPVAAPAPEPVADAGAEAEMAAGVEAMPGEEPVADASLDMAAADADVADAGADLADAGAAGEFGAEPDEDEGSTPLQKEVSKIAKEIQDTELEKGETKWLLDRFLRAFMPVAGVSEAEIPVEEPIPAPEPAPEVAPEPVAGDATPDGGEAENKMADLDIEDRQELADMILNVVPDEDIADLGQNVEDTDGDGIPDAPAEEPVELPMEEEECSECGGFAQYAESRGYTAESIMECGEEEMTNMISGYANAHDEGQNDGDFKVIALVVTPEILEKLKSEYGHDDFANEVEPFANEMNEASAEDKEAQINELFGGLKQLGQKAAGGIKQGVQQAGQAVKQAGQAVGQGVQQAATNVKQTYHAGEKNAALGKLEKVAANLGQQIASVNKHAEKSGEAPINVKSILSTISNQVAGAAGTADLGKFRTNEDGSIAIEEPIDGTGIEKPVNEADSIAVEEPIDGTGIEKPINEDGIPVDSTEVMPPMEEDVNISVSEKKGKALSAEKAPEVEMKENDEPEGEDVESPEAQVAPEGDDVLDLTKREEPEMPIISGVDGMGGGVVKPESAEITTVEVTKDSVKVEMNETELKLRKYIRNRLEEKAGIRKPMLNESAKSKTLQKLDRAIDKQFDLHEGITLDKIDAINEVLGFSIKEKFAKLNPEDQAGVDALFQQAFKRILINPKMAAIGRAAATTPVGEKYAALSQFVQNGGGTLRLKPKQSIDDLSPNTVEYATADVAADATPSQFAGGGTQGRMNWGGSAG